MAAAVVPSSNTGGTGGCSGGGKVLLWLLLAVWYKKCVEKDGPCAGDGGKVPSVPINSPACKVRLIQA